MIKNERQYRITKAQAAKFRRTLAEMRSRPRRRVAVDARLARAEREALASQLDDLVREIKDYERLKGGRTRKIRVDSLEELPARLIRARIAAQLSQKALAARVGLKEQQIQRYEAEDYASANLSRLAEIARALGVTMREEIEAAAAASVDEIVTRSAAGKHCCGSHRINRPVFPRSRRRLDRTLSGGPTRWRTGPCCRVFEPPRRGGDGPSSP